jgi:predicted nucleic acid-binding protein
LKWIEEGHFQWLYTEDILDEYKAILKRCKVRPVTIGSFINLLREEGIQVSVRKSSSISPDPDDDPFCACAEAGNAAFIVTLNPQDFPQNKLRAKVVCPSQTISSSVRSRKS